ncbi:ABC transporter permease [Burkholderia sp. MR1-5-21]
MDFSWIYDYSTILVDGFVQTLLLLVLSVLIGFALAIGLALAQLTKWKLFSLPAGWFCTTFRGTPLLLQLWFLYYGVGSLLPSIPGIRTSILWPVLRDGFTFAVIAFSLNLAAYLAEILRGALLSVPRGELEAAQACGMNYVLVARRVWMPRAFRLAIPSIAGEIVSQLKATPLAFTVTVMDLYGAVYKIRQDTFLVYEPLALVTIVYVLMAGMIAKIFKIVENQVPSRR